MEYTTYTGDYKDQRESSKRNSLQVSPGNREHGFLQAFTIESSDRVSPPQALPSSALQKSTGTAAQIFQG
jgi:hypothetical protein